MQAGRAEVRGVIERARERLAGGGRRTIFFLDEIHRFNKAQQDALLPAVEEGLVTLIGATTENPYFEVNSALLSRTRIYELEPLSPAHVRVLLDRAVARGECGPARSRGAGGARVSRRPVGRRRPDGAERARARVPDGGSRRGRRSGARRGCAPAPRAALRPAGRPPLRHDLGLDQGDPGVRSGRLAVLPGGDARGRRGPAVHRPQDGRARVRGHRQRRPVALSVATAAAAAVEHVGMPECQFALAQAAIYLSLAPKSDAAKRPCRRRAEFIREHGAEAPPPWLRSSTRSDGGYDNPHHRAGPLLAAGADAGLGDRGAVLRARRRRGAATRAARGDPPRAGQSLVRANLRSMEAATSLPPRSSNRSTPPPASRSGPFRSPRPRRFRP